MNEIAFKKSHDAEVVRRSTGRGPNDRGNHYLNQTLAAEWFMGSGYAAAEAIGALGHARLTRASSRFNSETLCEFLGPSLMKATNVF